MRVTAWRRFAQGAAAWSLVLAVGCVLSARRPDLPAAKRALVAYHDNGHYAADVVAVVARAQRHLRGVVAGGGKPAVVLDIDETALSTWAYQKGLFFGHYSPAWHEWIAKEEATAIAPTLRLFYEARRLGVAVFFVTGRRERFRAATASNLRKAGYSDWTGLTMKPDDFRGASTAAYKTAARRALVEQGYRIVLNLGDQNSDLAGGYAEQTFKVPNPIYEVP